MHQDKAAAIAPLGMRLRDQFREAEAERREVEERWLGDLRQYKGVYDPEVASRLHPKRSKAFLRLTRTKVRSVDARLADLLFPGNGERNWAVDPTPVPEVGAAAEAGLILGLADEIGRAPVREEVQGAVRDLARRAAEAMAMEIDDQLTECRYREVVRDVIHSGNLYGTGVLKGPLVERRKGLRWRPEEGGWTLADRKVLRPYIEFVPVWDIYPDMSARTLGEARYVFQRHLMTKFDLHSLAARPDFDGEAVLGHLGTMPEGDAGTKAHESVLQAMGGSEVRTGGRRRYEVLEFWGYVDGRDLAGCGCALDGDPGGREYAANVWLLGSTVVKAVLSPVEGVRWPYFFYHFDKDETSIFGEGLASIVRDPQFLFNASVRALLDNAAISAGPQIEVNQDLLPENEDPTDIHPFRVWLRSGRGSDSSAPAVRVYSLPSYAGEFMAMSELFARLMDETSSVPDFARGDRDAGAVSTAAGLSMLMSAASVTLKDQVKLFDEGITKPFITAMYHWNMQFSPKPELKGDFKVRARGWTGLVARELYVGQLDSFAKSTANGLDSPWINRGELLRRRAEARDLGPGIVKTDEELRGDLALAGLDRARPAGPAQEEDGNG